MRQFELDGPPAGALILVLSIFGLLIPLVITMSEWMHTGVWWRFAVEVCLSLYLIYWQLVRIFRAQDRRAIERLIQQ